MSKPIRYCFVSMEYPPETGWGGIGTYVRHMAQVARSCDMDVTVLTSSPHRENTYLENGVRIHRIVKKGGYLGWYKRVANFLSHNHFDWVEDAEFGASTLLYRLSRRLSSTRIHVRIHGSHGIIAYYERNRGLIRGKMTRLFDHMESLSAKTADRITAPGPSSKAIAGIRWNIPDEQIGLYPHPFKPEPCQIEHTNTDNSKSYILFFGRLQRLKHCTLLWDLANDSKVQKLGLRWLLVGRDLCGLGRRLELLEANMRSRICWIDHINDRNRLRKLIHDAALVFLPSRYESFGYTVLESLSLNPRTVVLSNSGPLEIMSSLGLYNNIVNEEELRIAPAVMIENILSRSYPSLESVRGLIDSRYSYDRVASAFRSCLAL